jgi:hypothetical protein
MATGVFVRVFVRERASQLFLPYTDSRSPSAQGESNCDGQSRRQNHHPQVRNDACMCARALALPASVSSMSFPICLSMLPPPFLALLPRSHTKKPLPPPPVY